MVSCHYKHYVFGSIPNLLTSLLYTSYISLNSLDATMECRGWTHDHLVSIGQPPLRYNHTSDNTLISHEDRNTVIRQEIWQIYTRCKWITPLEPLPSKMLYYKKHFMHFFWVRFYYAAKISRTRSRSQVEGSRIPLLDSFYNLMILGNFRNLIH